MSLGLFPEAGIGLKLGLEEPSMHASMTELDELQEMRENIRRSVAALELCWSCQRVCECAQDLVDDAAPVWLCQDCREKLAATAPPEPGSLLWPSPR